MEDAHASLTMWVNSMVHGVNDSEKYLEISKRVQIATTNDIAILVASQLRIINTHIQLVKLPAKRGYLHIFDDWSFTGLVPGSEMMDSIAKPP